MPNVNRWSLAQNQSPSPNPGAGLGIGRAQTPRSDAQVATATAGASPRDWQPTVLNLVILIVLELLAFAALRYTFRSAHGG